MKIQWKPLIVCVAVPLAVGGLSALLTREGMAVYSSLETPPLSPPGWLFPVVWTLLYVLMGISSYLIYTSGAPAEEIRSALRIYGIQLVVNFLWPIVFFNFGGYTAAFVLLLILWLLVLVTFIKFWRISIPAACLLIPYLIWTAFAGYLNLGVALLNP